MSRTPTLTTPSSDELEEPSLPSSSHPFQDNSTPMTQRIASFRLSSDKSPIDVRTLDTYLEQELRDATLSDVETLVDNCFPDEQLPFPVNDELLRSLTNVYNGQSWTTLNGLSSEAGFSDSLNAIGAALADQTGHKVIRQWTADFCSTPLRGSNIRRKPDMILIDVPNSRRLVRSPPGWLQVRAICEITSQHRLPSRLPYTLVNKAFLIFTTQHDRRFIPLLSFHQNRFQFSLCDRAGIIHSPHYAIDNHALILLRILSAFMFGNELDIGYDPTMYRGTDDNIETIRVSGEVYTVVRKIFSAPTLRGRATQCWHVQKDGKDYAIKDGWISSGRTHSEVDILRQILGVEGVPALIAGEDVQLPNGSTDSTTPFRAGTSYHEERVHRRLVMQPVGQPLYTFVSKKELVGAIIDIVKGMQHFYSSVYDLQCIPAHKFLCKDKFILHRDINYNNILIYRRSPEDVLRRGLLIDFDYAAPIDREGGFSTGDRTVRKFKVLDLCMVLMYL